MTGLSRRGLLRSVAAGAGVLLTGCTDMLLTAPVAPAPGYGQLVADPKRRLALPAGFGYQVVTEAGVTRLDSGEYTPRNHDGTGAFAAAGGGIVLVTNHEIREGAGTDLEVPRLEGLTYDAGAAGGCTVVLADAAGRPVSSRVGIAGTSTNCAGGVTPWNTWLTCEETEARAGANGFTKDHGYVFEVDPFDPAANRDPRPVMALGRFAHEAAVVDPGRDDVYLTEDAGGPNGLLYRWAAPEDFRGGKGSLRALGPTDGVLAAMRCTDGSGAHVDDLSRARKVGTRYAVEWVPIDDRAARDTPTRKQLADGDVTRGRKLEGAWWGDGGVYIVSSFARAESPARHDGQVWFYDPTRATLTLKLLFGAVEGDPFDGPDNISVSPHGGVIIAEDGEDAQYLLGATADGVTFPIARNDAGREFTGPVHSADGAVLFANIQVPGVTFAITGPWRRA